MSTFDNFLNNSIKVLLVSITCIMLIIGLLFVIPPVYADTSVFPDLTLQPSNSKDYAFQFASNSDSSYIYRIVIYGTTTDDYHMSMFAVSGTDSGTYIVHTISDVSDIDYLRYSNNSSVAGVQHLGKLQNEDYPLVYYSTIVSLPYNSSWNYDIPVFDTLEDGLSAYTVYLTGSVGGSISSFERTITIKPGYVAYIETDGGTLDLIANFHELSRFSQPLWDNGVRISFDGGLVPTSGTIFNNSFGSSVNWLKPASAPTNLLGQSMVGGRSYTAGLPEGGSNKCVVIYNPAYANADTIIGGGTPTIGPTITARFSNLVSVNQYALQGDVTRTFADGITVDSGSPNGYDEGYMYIPSDNDPSTVVGDSDYYQFNLADNTSSSAITIAAGGYNATADYGVSTAPEEAEKGIVGLLSRILQFLSTPITHIMNLFTAGGNLMAWLGQLWTWLPTDVGLVIVDALIVLVVIGAIKFLWK